MEHVSGRTTTGPNGVRRMPVPVGVDDPHLFCEALMVTLRATLSVDGVEAAATLAEALERLQRSSPPGLVLIDPIGPDTDGLRRLMQRAKAAPGVAIVIVSAPHKERVVASVLQIGASSGPRRRPRNMFIDAIEQGWTNGFCAPEAVAPPGPNGRATLDQRDAAELMKSLTPQQARILQLVCEGKFNKQIAYHLDISEGTVKAHLSAILRKLNVQNRTQAVLIAQSAGLARRDFRGEAWPDQ